VEIILMFTGNIFAKITTILHYQTFGIKKNLFFWLLEKQLTIPFLSG